MWNKVRKAGEEQERTAYQARIQVRLPIRHDRFDLGIPHRRRPILPAKILIQRFNFFSFLFGSSFFTSKLAKNAKSI